MADLNDFIDYLISKLGMMYVLGGQGGSFVDVLPKICAREENKIALVNNILTLLNKKLREGVDINTLEEYDCSGLFMAYALIHNIFKHDMRANDIYNAIPDKVKISKVKRGDFLFHGTTSNKTHIGYAIDEEWAIEARGTAYGVVKTRIKERGWQFAARPDFWSDKEKPALHRELYYKNPMMHGDDVGLLQIKLNGLDYNCGTADGYFGKKTEMAVKNFQSDENLIVDGIVGKKTAEALGFKWEG
jgi:hypothetical protein